MDRDTDWERGRNAGIEGVVAEEQESKSLVPNAAQGVREGAQSRRSTVDQEKEGHGSGGRGWIMEGSAGTTCTAR